jgi:acetyltransferase-like isoleucine patch superfamily enzyme
MNRLRDVLLHYPRLAMQTVNASTRSMVSRSEKKLKRRFLAWLLDVPTAAPERGVQARGVYFAPTAMLGPEGLVENHTDDDDRITVGAHSCIRGRLLTYGHGGCIKLGEWCYVGVRSEIWSMEAITIGNRVLISHDVNIHDGTAHSLDADERHAHFRLILERGHPKKSVDIPGVSSAPVVIEDDAWISFGVTILKGVRIGRGSVISAGSLVTKDVPPGVIYRCEVKPAITPLPGSAPR